MGPIGAQVLIGETVSCPGCRLLVEHDRGGEEIGGLTRVGIVEGRNEAGRAEVELGQGRARLVELDPVGSQRTCRDDSSSRQAGSAAWRSVELEEGVGPVESCREVGRRRKVQIQPSLSSGVAAGIVPVDASGEIAMGQSRTVGEPVLLESSRQTGPTMQMAQGAPLGQEASSGAAAAFRTHDVDHSSNGMTSVQG